MSYKMTYRNGKNIREHRAIMQDYLGRELLPTELIHHKDGNKRNNNISNLEILTRSEHLKIHKEVSELAHKSSRKYNVGLEILRDLYVEKALTSIQISKVLSVPRFSINNYIRKYSLKHKKKLIACKICGAPARYKIDELCDKCYHKLYYRRSRDAIA